MRTDVLIVCVEYQFVDRINEAGPITAWPSAAISNNSGFLGSFLGSEFGGAS
jgi:hypothetical protein